MEDGWGLMYFGEYQAGTRKFTLAYNLNFKRQSLHTVDDDDGEDHEDGNDQKGDFAPLL